MLAEWTAECQHDDAAIVVPWSDPASGLHYIDLRAEPYDIAEIHEAERFPALSRALRSLNAARSAFLTSKCDVWLLSPTENTDELEVLRLELGLHPDDCSHGVSSYIDVLPRERTIFTSAHHQQQRLDGLCRRAERLRHDEAAVSFVLRPSVYAQQTTLQGFAITVYVRAVAGDPATAMARWSAALTDIVSLLRATDLNTTQGSATIDSAPARAAAQTNSAASNDDAAAGE